MEQFLMTNDDQMSKMEDSVLSVVVETLKNDEIEQDGDSIINFDNLKTDHN